MKATLIYVHDPMCSWCWGFAPVYTELLRRLPEEVTVSRLLGGLASDTTEPMAESMRQMLQQVWHRIEEAIPGTTFNFDFWSQCTPRRATYPACRGVIAAREQGLEYDEIMTRRIQLAYYQQARNPSDNSTLIDLARDIGLSAERFAKVLTATETEEQLSAELHQVGSLGVNGFPSLVLEHGGRYEPVPVNYTQVEPMLDRIQAILTR